MTSRHVLLAAVFTTATGTWAAAEDLSLIHI